METIMSFLKIGSVALKFGCCPCCVNNVAGPGRGPEPLVNVYFLLLLEGVAVRISFVTW